MSLCNRAARGSKERGSDYGGRVPDEVERQREAVDLLAHDTVSPIAAEHTLIEPYEDQLHDNRRIAEVFAGFPDRFQDALAVPGTYTLAIHTRGGHLFPRKGQADAVNQLEEWVRLQKLPEPGMPPRGRPNNYVEGIPPATPVSVTLYRGQCLPEDDGSLRVTLQRSQDHEDHRVERIGRALRRKLPKLADARPPNGVSLLVLESNDFVLSNPVVIAQAVAVAAADLSSMPDAIIHVDTSAGPGHWTGYYVKIGDWWSPSSHDV